MGTEAYQNARVLVLDGYDIIISEMLQDVKYKSMQKLTEYDLDKWCTDYKKNNSDIINTLVIFVKKV